MNFTGRHRFHDIRHDQRSRDHDPKRFRRGYRLWNVASQINKGHFIWDILTLSYTYHAPTKVLARNAPMFLRRCSVENIGVKNFKKNKTKD